MAQRWVLVMDAGRAKLFECLKDYSLVPLLPTQHPEEILGHHGRSKDHHKPGWASETTHVFAPHNDWNQVQKELFCHEIAKFLDAHHEKFKELVLIAPPQVLGEMRGLVHNQVSKKITREIDKDFTKLSRGELEEVLLHS